MNKKNIAIIGSGISGLSMAYILNSNKHNFTIYEKNDYIGGHSRTIEVKSGNRTFNVDTGFMVYNHLNYPNLTQLFNLLNIKSIKTDMSFGVTIDNGNFEYSGSSIKGMFAQRKNILNIKFYKMLLDIGKFNKYSLKNLHNLDSKMTLGEYLNYLKVSDYCKYYYVLAMGGAIWSMPVKQMLDFPAKTFLSFLNNHKLLNLTDRPQWYTLVDGSKQYVDKLIKDFKDKIWLNTKVLKVFRENNRVQVYDSNNNNAEYDEVIFACHTNQILNVLNNPSTLEKEIIGAIEYTDSDIIVHSDVSLMPKEKNAWASWVYGAEFADNYKENKLSVTYWSNSLQGIDKKYPIFVSLNPIKMPAKEKIFNKYTFAHPKLDVKAIEAQNNMYKLQGNNNTWFVGAYTKHGFHEDGIRSAKDVATKMGFSIPWI